MDFCHLCRLGNCFQVHYFHLLNQRGLEFTALHHTNGSWSDTPLHNPAAEHLNASFCLNEAFKQTTSGRKRSCHRLVSLLSPSCSFTFVTCLLDCFCQPSRHDNMLAVYVSANHRHAHLRMCHRLHTILSKGRPIICPGVGPL